MALIELSLDSPAPPEAATPPPASFYRRAGLALTVVLVLALGGAAPVSSMLWSRLGGVPLPAGGDFQVTTDRIFTMDLDASPRVLTAWQSDPVRRLWSIEATGSGDPFLVRDATADLVLVQQGSSISVLDGRTGNLRWTSDVPVQRLTGTVGVVRKETFRPGTEYDPESGDPGRLYGVFGDSLHTEPALSTELRGVELATGRPLWSFKVPGSAFTAWPDEPGSAFAVLSAQKLTLISAETGRVVRERTVPRIDGQGPAMGEVVDNMVMVHYGAFGAGGKVVAYALDTLDERWHQDQPDPSGNPAACYGVSCTVTRDNLVVLDVDTGEPKWQASGPDILSFGPASVLEVRNLTTPVRSVSLGTGQTVADLDGWRDYYQVRGEPAVLLSRPQDTRTTAFGVLRAGRTAVQPLGVLPANVLQCQAAPGTVVCQTFEQLEVWSYRG
ncbi:outer membrane protein assembly factor BamB family protein [Actinoplanes friuliensis]|uniref:outer membrane protein assembly factor BamB family protein n=1 Tax=Actinoplanes friuliensis TaxID=196914 RepID=UPI0011DC8CBA|nr:PQQ-binding-like beta-propeller repeat protein [Actinoplanes friuliensis]